MPLITSMKKRSGQFGRRGKAAKNSTHPYLSLSKVD
jgi:hypothetical protein